VLAAPPVTRPPPMVYLDGFTGAQYLDKQPEIERYTGAFDGIWDSALDEPASQDLIVRVSAPVPPRARRR
jgi:Domain of unknown function (DUF5753)